MVTLGSGGFQCSLLALRMCLERRLCIVDGSSIGEQVFVAKSEPAKTSTGLF
jgi:hypothetical protein